MKKEKISLIYKLLIIIVCFIGLVLNFRIAPPNKMLLYFTTLSNISVLLFYLVTVILYITKKLKKNYIYYLIKGMVTMSITLTIVIYQFFLSDGFELYKVHQTACNFVHLYTPLLVIFDYIIFGEKGNLKKEYPLLWSSILIIYSIVCELYILVGKTFLNGDKYPYFYMNVEKYGFSGVIFNCIIIYFAYIAYGYLVYFLDYIVSKIVRKEKENG